MKKIPEMIMLAVILIFFTAHIVKTVSYYSFMKNADSTDAVVTKVNEYEDISNDPDEISRTYYVVEVNYSVNGTEYISEIKRDNVRLGVNDIVTVYYLTGDESNIRLEKDNKGTFKTTMTFVFLIGFMIFYTFIFTRRKKK